MKYRVLDFGIGRNTNCSHRILLAVFVFLVSPFFSFVAFAQADGIRSVNFSELSYRVGPPYCEYFGPVVKIHDGRFANKQGTFEVSRVLYGDLTGEGQEEAVVVANCTPTVTAHPGFENDLVYVYGIKNGQPALLATFAFGQPWNFTGRATEPERRDNLSLFDITGVWVDAGLISFEHMAGKARCCPTSYVTQAFHLTDGRFVLAGEERRPWKDSSTIAPEKGWLVVHGGGVVTNEVKERFVALAGGAGANFVFIPTAMSDKEIGHTVPAAKTETGIDPEKLKPHYEKWFGVRHATVLHTRDRARADSDGFVEPLRHASGVFIDGGRQWRLADVYLGTAVEREINALVARGGVVCGGSAGATIQGSFLVRGAPGTPRNTDGDNRIMMSPGHETGFGLLANSAIDQHVNTRGREADLDAVISAHPQLLGIGIDQSAAIVAHVDSFFVVGGQVAIHDGREHDCAQYYFLSSGQAFNLKTRSVDGPQTDGYPLTLTVTAASRTPSKSGIRTVGSGVLGSRDNSQEPTKVKIECDVSLYSVGKNVYPARLAGPHEIKIKTREIDSDRLREFNCKLTK
jgi:cyanophycinase